MTLSDGVEAWLGKLRDGVGDTLQTLNQAIIADCNNGLGLEEWALKVGKLSLISFFFFSIHNINMSFVLSITALNF